MKVKLLPGTGKYKYFAVVPTTDGHKRIGFGAAGYSDYTKHGDSVRKANYISRHALRENWDDPYTAGFWARWVLWNKKSIDSALDDIYARFGIKVTLER